MRVSYTASDDSSTGVAPRLSLVLQIGQRQVEVSGLVDSGASVNLLPYPVGVSLGAGWEKQPVVEPLVGSLGRMEARGLFVWIAHPQLAPAKPVRLVFAWTQVQDAPVLFGQVNFFLEYEVCFYRLQGYFEVNRAGGR